MDDGANWIRIQFEERSGLFCGFLVFDEVLLIHRRFPNLETTHFTILCALLLSLLLIHLLGEREKAA